MLQLYLQNTQRFDGMKQICKVTRTAIPLSDNIHQIFFLKNSYFLCLCVCSHSIQLALGIIQSLLCVITLTCAWVHAQVTAISLVIMCLDIYPCKHECLVSFQWSLRVKEHVNYQITDQSKPLSSANSAQKDYVPSEKTGTQDKAVTANRKPQCFINGWEASKGSHPGHCTCHSYWLEQPFAHQGLGSRQRSVECDICTSITCEGIVLYFGKYTCLLSCQDLYDPTLMVVR